jgi:hypothetical protein
MNRVVVISIRSPRGNRAGDFPRSLCLPPRLRGRRRPLSANTGSGCFLIWPLCCDRIIPSEKDYSEVKSAASVHKMLWRIHDRQVDPPRC